MMTYTPAKKSTLSRDLGFFYIFFGIVMTIVAIVYFIYDDKLISYMLDHIFFHLPEVNEIVGIILWMIYALMNVLIFLAAMVLLVAWQLVAPFIALLILPSIIGGAGLLYKKRWALKMLLVTGVFYGLIFFPLGIIITILTFKVNRRGRTARTI